MDYLSNTQLTQSGLEGAQGMLQDLYFEDKDLQDYSSLHYRQEALAKDIFGLTRSEVLNKRKSSGYRRKQMVRHMRTQSSLGNKLNVTMPGVGLSKDLEGFVLQSDTFDLDHNSSVTNPNLNIKEALRKSTTKMKMHLDPKIIQIGSQSFNNSKGIEQTYKSTVGNASSIGRKSRQLQPLPAAQTNKSKSWLAGRPTSVQDRDSAAVLTNTSFMH